MAKGEVLAKFQEHETKFDEVYKSIEPYLDQFDSFMVTEVNKFDAFLYNRLKFAPTVYIILRRIYSGVKWKFAAPRD